jgi:AcrR family transcriptional regulator
VAECKGHCGCGRLAWSSPGPVAASVVRGQGLVAEHNDPRVARTVQACEEAIVELASEQPISHITVADLAERARVTRATFYNHYTNPLDLLLQVLLGDLERAHHAEQERRAEGGHSAAEMLRLSIVDVVDHIERFKAVYQHAVHDPADGGVYEALVRHFAGYALAFIARCTHPDLPGANHRVIAQFLAHGFAGSIKAWLSDSSVDKGELVDAAVACAPGWWN